MIYEGDSDRQVDECREYSVSDYSAVAMQGTFGRQSKSVIRSIVFIGIGRIHMLKVRLQGTVKDIQWFGKLLEQHPKIRDAWSIEPFANKWKQTNIFSVYAEIEKRENTMQ